MTREHDLIQFIAQASSTLQSEYDRIFSSTVQDPGTAGDQGERNWANLLKDWLPSHFHIATRGQILAHDGTLSPQIDVVVLKPSYPKKLLTENNIWLADGVAAAFECKNTLTAAHVKEAVNTAKKVKLLTRPKDGNPVNELRSRIFYGLLAHSHSWKGDRSKPLENVANAFKEAVDQIDEPDLLLDVICVADLACWMQQMRVDRRVNPKLPPEDPKSDYYTIDTVLVRHLYEANSFSQNFKPIGSLFTHLTGLLALHDQPSRDLAICYDKVLTDGSYTNDWGRVWDISKLSPRVQQMLPYRWHFLWHVWDGWQWEF